MEKVYVRDLNDIQLGKVFDMNEKLQNDVYDDLVETEMAYIGDEIDILKPSLNDWSVGAYNRNFIEVKNKYVFTNALIELEECFNFFSKEQYEEVEKLRGAVQEYYLTSFADEDNENLDELASKLDNALDNVVDIILANWKYRLDFSLENIKDYFLDFYAENRLNENYFINADTYELFEEVVKSYR